jgi:hypothetical protein
MDYQDNLNNKSNNKKSDKSIYSGKHIRLKEEMLLSKSNKKSDNESNNKHNKDKKCKKK